MPFSSEWERWTAGERLVVALLAGALVVAAAIVALRVPTPPPEQARPKSEAALRPQTLSPPPVISINRATARELETLPGVGPDLARRIIEDRTRNGPFSSLDQLKRVKGIGAAKLEELRGRVSL